VNRLASLLRKHHHLFGINCRDATHTDIELLSIAGYNVVRFDLEHGHQSPGRVIELGRTASHLGMLPMVRLPELSRPLVQSMLDGGIPIITMPGIETVTHAREFVRLGKFPPLGTRGAVTSVAGVGYAPRRNIRRANLRANDETVLMVMIESDQGFHSLRDILQVDGIDIVGVGELDWTLSLLAPGGAREPRISSHVTSVVTEAKAAGKLVATSVTSIAQARDYVREGVDILLLGNDIGMKLSVFTETIGEFRASIEQGRARMRARRVR